MKSYIIWRRDVISGLSALSKHEIIEALLFAIYNEELAACIEIGDSKNPQALASLLRDANRDAKLVKEKEQLDADCIVRDKIYDPLLSKV